MLRLDPIIRRPALRYLAVTVAAVLVVVICRRIPQINETTAVLVFLVLIEVVAVGWGLAYSIYLSILSALLYDYYFLPPFQTLAIGDLRNWIALFAFLISAIFISRLSQSERKQTALSENRGREMQRLYEFGQQLLMEERLHDLARNSPRLVASIFGMRNVAVYLAESDQAHFVDSREDFVSIDPLRAAAQTPDAPPISWPGVRILPLMLGVRASGSVAMVEGNYSDGLYEAVAGLLAIALARAAALERFSRVEAAREGERLRSALLDSITHELRTPLTAIRVAATSLLSQPILEVGQRHELFSIIDEESARLDRLIGQAVEMAQLDTAGVQLRLRKQRVRDVVDEALEDSHALLRGREVNIEIPEILSPVPMDRELIRRVLRQLLENASKYSPAGTPISISAKLAAERLLVSIRNEGRGIDEAEQPLIFDKFYRGKRQQEHVQGTGMGLAIAKAILRVHNGGIDVISHPNQGAIFTFWIPLQNPSTD